MKTLTQVEPRTPISSLPYSITSAGAYYLTGNLTGATGTSGITITANDVTLDLNGYSLVGVTGSVDAIIVSGSHTNLRIGNGTVRGWGLDGIDAGSSQSGVFADLSIVGCGNTGFRPGTASVITRCTADANTQEGFLAYDGCVFDQCTASNNGAAGISTGRNCRITDCRAQSNGYDGIVAGSGSAVGGCTAANNSGNGIRTDSNSSIAACTASGNAGRGIYTLDACQLSQCTTAGNSGPGITAGSGSSIGGCTAKANLTRGIDAGADCSITHCAVIGTGNYGSANSNNYGIFAGDGSVLTDCTCRNYDGTDAATDTSGIYVLNNCTVNGCSVSANRLGILTGSNCLVTACSASGNRTTGIYLEGTNCTAKACVASGNAYEGIEVFSGYSTVEGCTVSGNSFFGISLISDGCVILNNTCDGNGSGLPSTAGIACNGGSRQRIEGNHLSNNNSRGLYVSSTSTHNIVAGNIAVTNAAQTIGYDVNTTNNDVGPIGRAATATSPWANIQY